MCSVTRGEDIAVTPKREVSAGGVVFRRTASGVEIALASRRTRGGDLVWGLPKGRIDAGETVEEAALREVREETGLDATIEAQLGRISYVYVWEKARISKVVHFFLMRATGGDISDHDDEMEEVRWFALADAADSAAYDSERDVIRRAVEAL
jgi:ADP-ribose pyrophosphatase YjhB (NUDIX family)